MADAEARFAINLDTSQAQAAGNALGSNLEQLKDKITKGSKALQEMQAAAARLKSSADVLRFEEAGKGLQKAQQDVGKFESRIASLREKLAQATNAKAAQGFQGQIAEAQKGLGAAQERVKALTATREKLGQKEAVKAYKDVTAAIKAKQGALADAQTELSRMGGTLTSTAQSAGGAAEGAGLFAGQISKLKALGPAGIAAAVAAAFVAVTVVIGQATYALVAWVTQLGDAARTARIFADATAQSEAGGEALMGTVNRVFQRVGGVRGEVQQLALDLRRLGVEGQALENSVEAVSAASRVFGQSSGAAIKGLIDRAQLVRRGVLSPLELRGTGLAFKDVAAAVAKNFKISMGAASAALANGRLKVEDFTRALRDATRARTGEALSKLALSLPEQFARARDNVEQIFKIDPSKILGGLNSILSLLDESTETGKTLRSLMKTVFQPIVDFVGSKIFPILRGIMLGVIATGIELAIVALDLAIAFKKILPADFGAKWDLVQIGFYVGVALAGLLTAGILVLTVAFAGLAASLFLLALFLIPPLLIGLLAMAVSFAVLVVGVLLFAAALLLPLAPIGLLIYGIKKLLGFFSDGGAGQQAGASLVDGIISGVLSRAGDLFKAIGSLATDGLNVFNKTAEIHSPARLFKPSGKQIPAGVAEGVEEGAPMVNAAVAGLVDPTALDAAGAAAGGAGAARGPVSLSVTIDARGSSPAAAEEKRSLIVELVETLEDALRQAGGTPIQLTSVEVVT